MLANNNKNIDKENLGEIEKNKEKIIPNKRTN